MPSELPLQSRPIDSIFCVLLLVTANLGCGSTGVPRQADGTGGSVENSRTPESEGSAPSADTAIVEDGTGASSSAATRPRAVSLASDEPALLPFHASSSTLHAETFDGRLHIIARDLGRTHPRYFSMGPDGQCGPVQDFDGGAPLVLDLEDCGSDLLTLTRASDGSHALQRLSKGRLSHVLDLPIKGQLTHGPELACGGNKAWVLYGVVERATVIGVVDNRIAWTRELPHPPGATGVDRMIHDASILPSPPAGDALIVARATPRKLDLLRVVPSGPIAQHLVANDGAFSPSLARYSDELVLAWVEGSPDSAVVARRFDSGFRERSSRAVLATPQDRRQHSLVRLYARGDGPFVVTRTESWEGPDFVTVEQFDNHRPNRMEPAHHWQSYVAAWYPTNEGSPNWSPLQHDFISNGAWLGEILHLIVPSQRTDFDRNRWHQAQALRYRVSAEP